MEICLDNKMCGRNIDCWKQEMLYSIYDNLCYGMWMFNED